MSILKPMEPRQDIPNIYNSLAHLQKSSHYREQKSRNSAKQNRNFGIKKQNYINLRRGVFRESDLRNEFGKSKQQQNNNSTNFQIDPYLVETGDIKIQQNALIAKISSLDPTVGQFVYQPQQMSNDRFPARGYAQSSLYSNNKIQFLKDSYKNNCNSNNYGFWDQYFNRQQNNMNNSGMNGYNIYRYQDKYKDNAFYMRPDKKNIQCLLRQGEKMIKYVREAEMKKKIKLRQQKIKYIEIDKWSVNDVIFWLDTLDDKFDGIKQVCNGLNGKDLISLKYDKNELKELNKTLDFKYRINKDIFKQFINIIYDEIQNKKPFDINIFYGGGILTMKKVKIYTSVIDIMKWIKKNTNVKGDISKLEYNGQELSIDGYLIDYGIQSRCVITCYFKVA